MNARTTGPALECHYQFLAWLLPQLDKLPRNHKFTLGNRMEDGALQVLDDLIAATYSRDRRAALTRANLGLEKLRFLFRLCKDLRLIDLRRFEFAVRSLDETGRLVGGWLKADAQAAGANANTMRWPDTSTLAAATRQCA